MAESFPMNGGDGIYSYTKNSQYQREASSVVEEMINEVIAEKLDVRSLTSTSNTFRIADLGCSVGPNTFFAMQNVLEAAERKHHSQGFTSQNLEFQVFFSDLTLSDFNTLFSSFPPNRKYFAAGVPGSFYDRLVPASSLHYVHSSYALNWLSKVPEEVLDQKSLAWNKGHIWYNNTSNEVTNAYATQFAKDMKNFLNARAEEIVIGGMMALIIAGITNGIHCYELPTSVLIDFLGSSLMDMADAGVIDEAQVDSFNFPVYVPSRKEMTEAVGKNGYFSIERMELTDHRSKMNDPLNAQSLVMHLRASLVGILRKHFGEKVIDELFDRTLKRSSENLDKLDATHKKETQLFVVLKRKLF